MALVSIFYSLSLSLFLSNICFLCLYFHISIKFIRWRSEFNIRLILLYSFREIFIVCIVYILIYNIFKKIICINNFNFNFVVFKSIFIKNSHNMILFSFHCNKKYKRNSIRNRKIYIYIVRKYLRKNILKKL